MDSNINQLNLPSAPSVSWTSLRAKETQADFLSLRLLNKRTRIRLSDKPLDLGLSDGQGNYFAVSNARGWFAAIASGNKLILSPLDVLRTAITSSRIEGEELLKPQRVLQLFDMPTHLAFASNDERLVISFATGAIAIYDTAMLFSEGSNNVDALRIFPAAFPRAVRQVLANPGDLPDLVAVRRDATSGSDGLIVEVIDARQLQTVGGWTLASSSKEMPTSIAWSTKGKQLALGLRGGDIATYIPTDVANIKLLVPRPPSAEGHSVISLLWLSNQAFYGIYAPEGSRDPECTQKHILTSFDHKTNSASQTEFETPYYPSPGLRPPGAFTAVMRSWEPANLLAFISDSTSSDIGVIGSVKKDGSDVWCNLSLEETSTPGVPLDKEAEDTVPMALEMDLTLLPEGQDPSTPVLYLYASDGTLQAWCVTNTKAGPYPGMIKTSPSAVAPTVRPSPSTPSGNFGTAPSPSTANPTFGAANDTSGSPAFGQGSPASAFGSTSLTKAQPNFGSSNLGQSSFGQPAFGHPSFGKNASSPPFMSNTNTQAQSAFGSSSGDLGAFADSGSKFGQTSAFGVHSTPHSSTKSQDADFGSPEAEMAEEDDNAGNGFGSLSLGSSAASTSVPEGTPNKMFGSFTQVPTTSQVSPSPFVAGTTSASTASSSFLKPATGFGAFGNKLAAAGNDQETAKLLQTPKPASGFGQSGFASTTPAFGQPSFGQSSSFGQPSAFGSSAFGRSGPDDSFGAPSTPTPSSTATTSGGFGAFAGASKGFGSFAQNGSSAFGQQASSMSPQTSESPSIAMASSTDTIAPKSAMSEDKPDTPFNAFAKKDPFTPAPFGKPAINMFGSTTPAGSPFGGSQISNMMGGKDALKASVDRKPTSFTTPDRSGSTKSSPDSSPDMSGTSKVDELTLESPKVVDEDLPSTPSVQSTTPFGTPATSVFGKSNATPVGAFGNLKTTQSAFGPSQGFGAFGSGSKLPSSSPFANPRPAGSLTSFATPGKPVSVFVPGGVGPTSTTPTFGSPSTPGGTSMFGKSSFGTPATPTPASTTPLGTPSGGAFSAFSGGVSAFAKVDKASSFSDLLKQGDSEKASKNNAEEKAAPAVEQELEDDEPKLSSGLSRTESSFVSVSKPEDFDLDNLPPTPSTHGTFDQEEQELGDEGLQENDAESFLSESFEGSEEGAESEEAVERSAEEEEDNDAEGNDEDASISEGEDEEEDDEDEEDEDEDGEEEEEGTPSFSKERTPQPDSSAQAQGIERSSPAESVTSIPIESKESKSSETPLPLLSGTKSGSSIPTLFGRPITPSQTPAEPAKATPASTVNKLTSETSPSLTTPTLTSPALQQSPRMESKPLPAPTPVIAPSLTPVFGLGRPSSRPTRSSPLAGSPVPGEKGSEGMQSPVSATATIARLRPASPKTPFGQLPVSSKAESPFATPNAPGTSSVVQQKPSFPGTASSSQASLTPGAFSFVSQAQTTTKGQSKMEQRANGPTNSTQQQTPAAQMPFESSMQRECQSLYVDMQKELEFLGKVAQTAATTRINLGRPARSSHTKDDLGDKTKWCFGDLDDFARLLKHIEKTVILANKLKDQFTPLMRELEGDQLKAETLKEEIIRFSKAKADPEFARMLKERTLGPDAAETQNQLRKHIRLINDRVEQLEGHFISCKKKVEERRKGKPSLKPPSLDTINRTYRNIDISIEAQAHQIEDLTRRVSKLNVDALDATLNGPSISRGRRSLTNEDESASTGHWKRNGSLDRSQVTPSIAASTAAALNAERNALRLKNALAKTRKTPLLNTQATHPVRQTPTIDSLHKQSEVPPSTDLSTSTSSNGSVQESRSNLDRRTSRNTRHVNSVKLGKTHQRVPSSISTFDWGPLPKAAPMTTLPVAIIPQPSSNAYQR